MASTMPALVIFDVDGTLYEEAAVYERFAAELARFVPPDRRESFLAEWRAAADGRHAVRVGLGYDTRTDTLFRHDGGRIVAVSDWQGRPLPALAGQVSAPGGGHSGAHPPGAPPVETTLFGEHVLNIGDMWGLTDAIAAHHGVPRSERSAAFLATRAAMDEPAFALRAAPGLAEMLRQLRRRRVQTLAMTNSPEATTRIALGKLGIGGLFDAVHTEARKPRGLRALLAAHDAPARALVVGDNYVNEIEPALQAGAAALYIDRFATRLGADQARCACVDSIAAMVGKLEELLGSERAHERGPSLREEA
jgi:putative hydrolase of the HAD superfamily